jgi:hypothetical protein
MNTLAISPQLCVHMLQAQNVQRKHVNVFAKSKKDGAAVKEETDEKILTEQIIPPNSTLPVELQESLEHAVISTSEIAVTPPELS